MGTPLCIDRFEGPDKGLAVLVADDGREAIVARSLLPEGAEPGWVIDCTFVHNKESSERLAGEVRAVQAELRTTDPGGDIRL